MTRDSGGVRGHRRRRTVEHRGNPPPTSMRWWAVIGTVPVYGAGTDVTRDRQVRRRRGGVVERTRGSGSDVSCRGRVRLWDDGIDTSALAALNPDNRLRGYRSGRRLLPAPADRRSGRISLLPAIATRYGTGPTDRTTGDRATLCRPLPATKRSWAGPPAIVRRRPGERLYTAFCGPSTAGCPGNPRTPVVEDGRSSG